MYWYSGNRAVYCLDFSVFEPPKDWKVTHEFIIDTFRKSNPNFTEESLEFMERLIQRAGTGNGTHWPPGLRNNEHTLEQARLESEIVLSGVVEDVLKKTNTQPKDIDILIINCSLYSPTPSMCAMIANKFKMRADLDSYNLSGMGCS